jgi:aspartate racemase
MRESLCLGLVGGLGVGATIHYYTELTKAHEARGRTLNFVMAHAETSRVFAYVQAEDRDGLAQYLAGFINRLRDAGADIAAIPAITPHYCMHELVTISPVPLVNIFDPLMHELTARSIRKAAVFGTRYVVESALYGFVKGCEIVQPAPEEVDLIHGIYTELLQQRKGSEEQRRKLTALANTLRQRDGVEAIIFAGTDLALLFNESNTEFPYLDCAALHIEAIVKRLLNE